MFGLPVGGMNMKKMILALSCVLACTAVSCASSGGAAKNQPKSSKDSIQVALAEASGWNVTPKGRALYEEGLRYYFGVEGEGGVAKDRQRAFDAFSQAGMYEGHPDAAYMAGMMSMLGRDKSSVGSSNIPKDENTASKFFLIASEQGHAKAQVEAGLLYLKGYYNSPFVQYNDDNKKMKENDEQLCLKSKKFFENGVSRGVARAKYGLGEILIQGYCVDGNPKEALKLFEEAAEENVVEAQVKLVSIYCTESLDRSCKNYGIPKDNAKALKYAQMAQDYDHVIDRDLNIVDEENLHTSYVSSQLLNALKR